MASSSLSLKSFNGKKTIGRRRSTRVFQNTVNKENERPVTHDINCLLKTNFVSHSNLSKRYTISLFEASKIIEVISCGNSNGHVRPTLDYVVAKRLNRPLHVLEIFHVKTEDFRKQIDKFRGICCDSVLKVTAGCNPSKSDTAPLEKTYYYSGKNIKIENRDDMAYGGEQKLFGGSTGSPSLHCSNVNFLKTPMKNYSTTHRNLSASAGSPQNIKNILDQDTRDRIESNAENSCVFASTPKNSRNRALKRPFQQSQEEPACSHDHCTFNCTVSPIRPPLNHIKKEVLSPIRIRKQKTINISDYPDFRRSLCYFTAEDADDILSKLTLKDQKYLNGSNLSSDSDSDSGTSSYFSQLMKEC